LDLSIGIDENNTLLLKFLFGGRGKLFLGQSIMRGKLFLGQSIGIETNTFHQSIGIDENNTFHFYSSIKTVGTTVLGGLWALEWAWHVLKQLALRKKLRNLHAYLNSLAPIVSEIWLDRLGGRTDGHG